MIAWFAGQPLVLKIVLGGLGSILLVFLLWRLWLRQYLEWQNVRTLEIEKRVGLKIEFIKTAAQILGGVFFLGTFYIAYQNLVVSQEKYRTDLFVQAVKQLGDEKLEVQLGGIYALERIARDSEKDHGPIMEVLTAYVRENAPWPPKKANGAKEQPAEPGKLPPGEKKPEDKPAPEVKPRADIQAILTVLGRRARIYKKEGDQHLDLRQTDLRRADLSQAHLEGAVLREAHLNLAMLTEAHLEGAVLEEAHLGFAMLIAAHLEGADLQKANLGLAQVSGHQVRQARNWVLAYLPEYMLANLGLPQDHNRRLRDHNLSGDHFDKLVGLDLRGASFSFMNLQGANLKEARLEGASFNFANLEKAHLEGAKLMGADLTGAKGLTKEQIVSAIIDEKTQLPYYLKQAGPDKAKPQ